MSPGSRTRRRSSGATEREMRRGAIAILVGLGIGAGACPRASPPTPADAGGVTPVQISVGKLNNVREAIEIARTCRTVLGGSGITLEYPVLRHASNLESVLTYEGTSEVHALAIGQALTGISAYR